jgi:alkaline phosphatase D
MLQRWCLRSIHLAACLASVAALGCSEADDVEPEDAGLPGDPASTRIAFGSCMHEELPKPVLDLAVASAPDLFVFLGDNLYGDTDDMAVLAAKYELLGTSPELQDVRAAMPVIATWDDHDFGRDDAGKEYPYKAESKALFMDFWGEPADSPRRSREGIYTSYLFEETGGTVQVILLDTRWFRDALEPTTDLEQFKHAYTPTSDASKTILGEAQWEWLAVELAKPADVRIIGTSIQLGHEYNGWESWTNMPHERQRMIDLLRDTGAEATVFISGDVHWAELSKLDVPGGYPLYDLTSSGITEEWPEIDTNANRIGAPVPDNNYGFVEIVWGDGDERLTFGIVDVFGETRIRHEVTTTELRF